MRVWRRVVIAGLAALAFTGVANGRADRHEALLPTRGVLIGGVSLAEVQLGDSPRAVELAWGTNHMSCGSCRLRTWLFVYPSRPAGAAVTFDRRGHAVAVFTIGQPFGWRTAGGLWVGARITAEHGAATMAHADCAGYDALSRRDGDVVTTIYTRAGSVYGFALTVPGQPVCQSPERAPTQTPSTAVA
jgi:hypothetical protein